MTNLHRLYELATQRRNDWRSPEMVNLSDAAELITACRTLPEPILSRLMEVGEIVAYAGKNSDWDAEVVQGWPESIISDLDTRRTFHYYREASEGWEVYSLTPSEPEQLQGTVKTEAMAQLLVFGLSKQSKASANDAAFGPGQMMADLVVSRLNSGGQDASAASRRVRMHLSANLIYRHSEEIEVPIEY